MAKVFCNNCGVDIEETAKFCRRCGQPSDMSEATTRNLDSRDAYQPPTTRIDSASTGPSFYTPGEMFPLPAPNTKGLDQSGRKRTLWIIAAAMMAFMLIAFGALAFLLMRVEPSGPRGDIPTPPDIPGVIAPPPPPSPPPPPPGDTGSTGSTSRSLTYPGSEETMNIINGQGETVRQLRTNDPVNKVVDWYIARLKPNKKVSLPGRMMILETDNVKAMIIGTDNQTNITITQTSSR